MCFYFLTTYFFPVDSVKTKKIAQVQYSLSYLPYMISQLRSIETLKTLHWCELSSLQAFTPMWRGSCPPGVNQSRTNHEGFEQHMREVLCSTPSQSMSRRGNLITRGSCTERKLSLPRSVYLSYKFI